MILRYYPSIGYIIACFFHAGKEDPIPITGDYLPLQVGNYWEMEHQVKFSLVGTRYFNNRLYYTLIEGTDTSYYRNSSDKIYLRHTSGSESVKFNLNAQIGDFWEFQDGGTTWIVGMCSKTDTITINNMKIPNCYRFCFDIPMSVGCSI